MKRPAFIFGLIFLFAVAAILSAASCGQVGTERDALMQAGLSLYQQANYGDALVQAEQAVECYQEIGDRAGEGTSLNNIGSTSNARPSALNWPKPRPPTPRTRSRWPAWKPD